MGKYKHLRVKEITHNKVLMIRGILGTKGENVSLQDLIDSIVSEKLNKLELEKTTKG